MDVGIRSPLVDAFRRTDVPKEVRMDAAAGLVAPRGQEQLALFAMLVDDADAEVREVAERTLAAILPRAIADVLARTDTPADLIRFFGARGIAPSVIAMQVCNMIGLPSEARVNDMVVVPAWQTT